MRYHSILYNLDIGSYADDVTLFAAVKSYDKVIETLKIVSKYVFLGLGVISREGRSDLATLLNEILKMS